MVFLYHFPHEMQILFSFIARKKLNHSLKYATFALFSSSDAYIHFPMKIYVRDLLLLQGHISAELKIICSFHLTTSVFQIADCNS